MGLTCTICGGKKKPSYELSVCFWCFESERGAFGVIFMFFLSQTKQNKTNPKKKKTYPLMRIFFSFCFFTTQSPHSDRSTTNYTNGEDNKLWFKRTRGIGLQGNAT